jgi:hypothetical protein
VGWPDVTIKIESMSRRPFPLDVFMKRYLLFCYSQYYPSGGWNDFEGSFDTIEDAQNAAHGDWWHIVDTEDGRTCASGSNLKNNGGYF